MTLEEFAQRDTILRHAIQSGVAAEMIIDFPLLPPEIARALKHIRVGLNCAMAEHGFIMDLLIKKGIISEQEYFETSLKALEAEVKQAEKRLSQHYGKEVRLL